VDLKRSKNEFCSSWANVSHNVEGPRKNLTEQKTFGIPFRRTKMEENFWNFVVKHIAEENLLSILFAGHRKHSF
jgi:hypothetical protein